MGPTFSDRISRRRATWSSFGSTMLRRADSRLRPREQPGDIGPVLPEDEQGEAEEQQGEVDPAGDGGRDGRDRRCRQSSDRRITGEAEHAEPCQCISERHRPAEAVRQAEAHDDAEIGRDPLAALETEPDGREVADQGGDGGELHGDREQPGGHHHGGAPLRHVEQQSGGGEALAAGPQHVGGADIARADGAQIAGARRLGQQQAERDRAQAIAERDCEQRFGDRCVHASRLPGEKSIISMSRRNNLPRKARGSAGAPPACGPCPRCYSSAVTGARPLLIFDSGVGGLSVAGAIRTELPQAPLVYVGDAAGYPYGTKPASLIEARVPALLGRLAERFDPELIVIACNTASTIALDAVRAALELSN